MKEAQNSEDLNQGVSLSIAKDVEDSDSDNE